MEKTSLSRVDYGSISLDIVCISQIMKDKYLEN